MMMARVSQEHLDARREQILTAALYCFASEGYQRATMQDVARRAGLSAGSLYNYFESKEAIIEALAELSVQKMGMLIACLQERRSVREAVQGFAGRIADALAAPDARELARFNVVLWSEALSVPGLEERMSAADAKVVDQIASLVREGQQQGEVPEGVSPRGIAEAVLIYVTGMVARTAFDPEFRPAEHWRAVGARLIGSGVWT